MDCDYYTELDAVELFGIKPEKGKSTCVRSVESKVHHRVGFTAS